MNIMPPRRLSVTNPDEVASPNYMELLVGSSPSKLMLIFTGIAMPVLRSNGQLDGQEITIDLNRKSNTRSPQFTAVAGLAGIYNEATDLLFATDDVTVIVDENMSLLLKCNIATMGNTSFLNRFSYQATVLLEGNNGTISGMIKWNPHFLTFDPAGTMEHKLFLIQAFSMNFVNDNNGFGKQVIKLEKIGHTIGSVIKVDHGMGIPYEITDLPVGVPLFVTVTPNEGAFLITNSNSLFNFVQITGPAIIQLSAAHLTEKPVDFEAKEAPLSPH